jgi:4-hydroxy-tetrahydrodipicolinate synthase
MMPREWGRFLTAMITPFHADGSVNFDEAERIAAYLIDEQQNDGVVINGTTGESPTLKDHEKFELLRRTISTIGNRASVLFGASTYDTDESLHLVRRATEAGAHGIMLVNPYYNRPGQEGLLAHFSTLASATDLPVLLYNIAPRSSINLETETLLRLAEIPNVVAVKEASGNITQIGEVAARVPDGFRVYSGDDGLTLPILSLGGFGVVSVAGHIVGREIAEMVRVFDSSPARARQIHRQLLPTFRALFSAPSPVPVKYAMSLLGFASEKVRLPLVALSEDEKSMVRSGLPNAAFSLV